MTKYKARSSIYINKYWGEWSKLHAGIVKLQIKGLQNVQSKQGDKKDNADDVKAKVFFFEVQGQVKEEQVVI